MNKLNTPIWRDNSDGYSFTAIKNVHIGPLSAGMYKSFYAVSTGEFHHVPIAKKSDNLLNLPGLPIDYILNRIKAFWQSTEDFKKYGFLQKCGIMLYGPPGCGKSSIIGLLLDELFKNNGICFVPHDSFTDLTRGIADFRTQEPDRPIMTLVEDIETLLESSNGSLVAQAEKAALALYDGESQFNNIIHVATTNKPEVIADRFIRRPGRFDIVIGIHAPSREARQMYLEKICNGHLTNHQANEILDKTEGLSLAYMREIASTYLVLNISLDETIARLQAQAKAKYKSNKTGYTIGFNEEGKE